MAWLIWLLTLVAAEASGTKVAPKAVSQSAQPSWIILPPEEAEHFLHPCSRPTPEGLSGSWTPTPADIAPAEALLPRRIAAEIAKVRPEFRPKEPARYYRQYGGVLLGNRRLIFVVGLAKAMVDRRPVAPSDLIDVTIDRVAPTRVMTFSFYRGGDVVATVGERGGRLTGPVWKWRIDKHGVLLVGDKYAGYGRFRKRCEDDHRLLIDMGGRTLTEFKRTKG
jgi:hypothetical protein